MIVNKEFNPKIKNWFEYGGTQHKLEKYALVTILKSDFNFIEWFNRKTTGHCGAGSALQAPVDSRAASTTTARHIADIKSVDKIKIWSKNLDILAVYDECLHIQINFWYLDGMIQ